MSCGFFTTKKRKVWKGSFNMTTASPPAPRRKKNKNNKLILTAKTRRKSNISYDWIYTKYLYFRLKQKPLTLVQIIFNRSYSVGFIHGTVIVRSDRYSWCVAWFRIASIAICYVCQWSTLHVHAQVGIFANDTTLLAASDFANVEDLENTLSQEVSKVDEWATNNKLLLIVPKLRRF